MSLGVRAEQTRLMSCKLEGCTFYDAGELTDNVVYYLRETMDMLVDLCSRGVGIRLHPSQIRVVSVQVVSVQRVHGRWYTPSTSCAT